MRITYRTNELERVCNDSFFAVKKYGRISANRLRECINALKAFDTVEALISSRAARRCYPLHGDRAGQFAMDLEHPYRLVSERLKDGSIQIAFIIEIEDYHKKGGKK